MYPSLHTMTTTNTTIQCTTCTNKHEVHYHKILLHYHCKESKIWIVQCQYCDFSTILTKRIHNWNRYEETHLTTCTFDFGKFTNTYWYDYT